MIDIQTIRQMIREESPARFDIGTVLAADVRGDHTVGVRTSGTGAMTRAMTCVRDLQPGDRVLVVYIVRIDRVVVVAQILDEYEGGLSRQGQLSPPNNLTYTPIPAGVEVRWDTWPGEDLCWQVRYNSSASDTDATDVLITRGSYYLHWTVDASGDMDTAATTYFRARAVRWIGDSNIMFSAWSAWSAAQTSGGHNLREIVELEFENAAALMISNGAITRTQVYHQVDTANSIPTDDLDTINGGTEGDLLIIWPEDGARTVVVKHNTGNIWLSGKADISLDDTDDHLMLIYDGAMWADTSGGGGAGATTFLALTDTPAAYGGHAGHLPAVNAGESALQWIAAAGWLGISDVSELAWQPDAVAVLHLGRIYEYADPDDAFTAAVANDVILVPPGTWVLSATHAVTDVSIHGMGPLAECVLKAATDVGDIFIQTTNGAVDNVTILYEPTRNDAVNSVTAFKAIDTNVRDVFAKCDNSGYTALALGILSDDARLEQCRGEGLSASNGYGIYLDGATRDRVYYCTAIGAGTGAGDGWGLIVASAASYIDFCYVEGTGGGANSVGIYVSGGTHHARHNTFVGGDVDVEVDSGTLNVYSCQYDTLTGAVTQLSGDRAGTALNETIAGVWIFDEEITQAEQADPASPGAGYGRIYPKADGTQTKYYFQDDAGTVYELQGIAEDVTVTVKAAGGDFTAIQDAVTWFKNWIVRGACVIEVDAGTYDERVDFSDMLIVGGSTLTLEGDTRLLAGMSFFDGAMSNREDVDDDKAGTKDGVISLVGNTGQKVITVTNGGAKNPDFDADGWGSGDKVLVYEWAAGPVWTATEYTIDSVLNNAITLTINLANGGVSTAGTGDDGAGITLLPDRRIEPTSNGAVVTTVGVRGPQLDGFFLEPNTTGYNGITVEDGGMCANENVVVRNASFAFYSSMLGAYCKCTECTAVWESAVGCGARSAANGLFMNTYTIECTYGAWSTQFSYLYPRQTCHIKCTDAVRADTQAIIYGYECTARHCTVGYRSVANSLNFAAQTDANNNNPGGTDYVPAPGGAGQYAEDAANFGVLFYSA